MSADLLSSGWPQGVARILLDTVDSTNAEAARLAQLTKAPTWILAAEQMGGRGRRGRPWASPRGNLYSTLLVFPTDTMERVALRSFVAALALRDAGVAVHGQADAFTLKWPNDVLLNGGKFAGILLESSGSGGRIGHLAIGIGANLATAPGADQVEPTALRPVSLAGETGVAVSPEAFLTELAQAYARWDRIFVTQGFAPVRSAWLAHAARLGQTITARVGGKTLTGRYETIDDTGALILHTAEAREVIPAADIFFDPRG